MDDVDLGPYFCGNPHHALLHHVLECVVGRYPRKLWADTGNSILEGVALEFGVGEGDSLRCIAEWMPAIGFDSFEGLPEDWRPGFDKGMFATDESRAWDGLPGHSGIVKGRFKDSLPRTNWEVMRPIRLVHIDCDLYSSTKTVLKYLPWDDMIMAKSVIIFDEYWGYPEAELHEQRAWMEYSTANSLEYKVIGHGVQQLAVRLV